MALHVPKAPGFSQMLKDGARHFSGLEEAVYRNISACKDFADTVRTAYGPNGMNKIVINHIDKLFVTNDAATIIRELDVEHPAAKLIILGSQMQEEEMGDGTNFVIIFAGALLSNADNLLRMGLTPSEVINGYKLALAKSLEILPTLSCFEVKDVRNTEHVTKAMKTAIMSKQSMKMKSSLRISLLRHVFPSCRTAVLRSTSTMFGSRRSSARVCSTRRLSREWCSREV
uniref:T-complex protein 1 subunit theta n=1 Tax=Cacopsylla melanoneura TaxID=428564 RepID=A0A8D9AF76_9HEMI